jgi:hypothetical protein
MLDQKTPVKKRAAFRGIREKSLQTTQYTHLYQKLKPGLINNIAIALLEI